VDALTRPRAQREADAPDSEVSLLDTVVALGEEIQGLRASAQLRAVIEQAKGVLVERHHISLDEAFDRLRAMSQEHNVRLVEVAATMVGIALPEEATSTPELSEHVLRGRLPSSPAASPAWRALSQEPNVRAGVLMSLIDSIAGSSGPGEGAAQLLADLLSPQGVEAVTLYRPLADGSLRLVGSAGIPGDVASSWFSIPPSRLIPYVLSATEDREFFWEDRATRAKEFPASVSTPSAFEAAATVPIHDEGAVVGVAGLMWTTRQSLDEQRRAKITATVQRVGQILMRNAWAADPELEWLTSLLGLHLDPWLLLEAVRPEALIGDFVVQDASPQLREASGWIGRRLIELWPSVTTDGLGQSLVGLARSGGSWTMTVGVASDGPWSTPGSRVRAVRLGHRIVLVWRPGAL
jgi:hypothetical protein